MTYLQKYFFDIYKWIVQYFIQIYKSRHPYTFNNLRISRCTDYFPTQIPNIQLPQTHPPIEIRTLFQFVNSYPLPLNLYPTHINDIFSSSTVMHRHPRHRNPGHLMSLIGGWYCSFKQTTITKTGLFLATIILW